MVNANSDKEADMQPETKNDPVKTANEKLSSGALLSLEEVAALFDVTPVTVLRLPLPSIRLGRQYRFDPKDVIKLINENKEAI